MPSFSQYAVEKMKDLYNNHSHEVGIEIDLEWLKKILFGVGISRGGDHMWLFSEGIVYEVHWDEYPSLYQKRPIIDFPWLDNIILVPPDGASTILIAKCACAAASQR